MHNIYYLGLSGEQSLPFGLLVAYAKGRFSHEAAHLQAVTMICAIMTKTLESSS